MAQQVIIFEVRSVTEQSPSLVRSYAPEGATYTGMIAHILVVVLTICKDHTTVLCFNDCSKLCKPSICTCELGTVCGVSDCEDSNLLNCSCFESLASLFTQRCSSSLSCMCEYLAFDSGAYMWKNNCRVAECFPLKSRGSSIEQICQRIKYKEL